MLKKGVGNLTLDTWQKCLLKGKKRGGEERIEEGKGREGKEVLIGKKINYCNTCMRRNS